ncbi:hypothetical protein BCF44_102485 [Kutzneria buriramensis]|uniref:Uncharacterized protein n=1 Tax=Kutzneria buriramensis TaxID=1045776 RepID=A0A3E0I6A0_9PSEU|nr:hypothetical protein BCF44_102485 [Kutzneria buriramensis]
MDTPSSASRRRDPGTGHPDLSDEPDASPGRHDAFIDLTLGHSAPDNDNRNTRRDNYRQLSPTTRPNITATARHLAGHRSAGCLGTAPELFPPVLAQPNSLSMG